jgi:hypothetical protein
MNAYSNENRGSIWPNKKKETDKHPDFTGSLNVGGHDYWVSAWKRKPDASPNAPSLSFQVKLKDGKPMDEQRQTARPSVKEEMSDDIPF